MCVWCGRAKISARPTCATLITRIRGFEPDCGPWLCPRIVVVFERVPRRTPEFTTTNDNAEKVLPGTPNPRFSVRGRLGQGFRPYRSALHCNPHRNESDDERTLPASANQAFLEFAQLHLSKLLSNHQRASAFRPVQRRNGGDRAL